VFTILFGSYFGDWDSQNNLMRSALAQGKILTCAWGGRPHWYFHHMGLGENIGYSALQTQNNNGLYYTHYAGKFVHIGLLGDPTLRNDIVVPPANLQAQLTNAEVNLSWSAPADSVLGYMVYMKGPNARSFEKLHADLWKDTFFTLPCAVDTGKYVFMVKRVALENHFSGSYYNTSQGLFDTLHQVNATKAVAAASFSINKNTVSFANQSQNASSIAWIFDNGQTSSESNPIIYLAAGLHTATLIASNDCSSDTIILTLEITSNTNENIAVQHFPLLYPNPAQNELTWLLTPALKNTAVRLEIQNSQGRTVFVTPEIREKGSQDISFLPNGFYMFSVVDKNGRQTTQTFVVTR
jgi:hypothetical protein